jgi:hypothetical protein
MKNPYMNLRKDIHQYTSDDKLKWWGYGEWVEEPDIIIFNYKGFDCKVIRVAAKEIFSEELSVFGGHFCGYIKIPPEHPFYHKSFDDVDLDIYGGLTINAISQDDEHWIAFDCCNCNDVVPSEKIKKFIIEIYSEFYKSHKMILADISDKLKNSPCLFPTYKNLKFCIEECKHVIEQLLILAKIGQS